MLHRIVVEHLGLVDYALRALLGFVQTVAHFGQVYGYEPCQHIAAVAVGFQLRIFEGKLWNFIKSLCEQIILLYLLVHFLLKGVKRHQVAVELVIQGRCLVASVGLVKNIVALLRVEHQFYLVAFVQNTHYLLVILLAHHLKVGEVLHLLLVKS